MKTLTDIQIKTAHRLAGAHGHLWGHLPLSALKGGMSRGEIVEAVVDCLYDGDAEAVWGIAAPDTEIVDDETVVVHTTGSGRTRWSVYPDGVTEVRVSSPDRGELIVWSGDGSDPSPEAIWIGGAYNERHAQALVEAVRGAFPDIAETVAAQLSAISPALPDALACGTPDEVALVRAQFGEMESLAEYSARGGESLLGVSFYGNVPYDVAAKGERVYPLLDGRIEILPYKVAA